MSTPLSPAAKRRWRKIERDFHVRAFGEEMARINFLPEKRRKQAVAEMIQEQGYQGIKYRSSMRSGGHNYTFFKPVEFEVEYLRAVKVTASKLETEFLKDE